MPLSAIRNIVSRKYSDFRGIDLLNNETNVDYRRSPDCLNVWKSYNLSQSNIIQSRPGLTLLAKLGNDSIHSIYIWNSNTAIVHIGGDLVKWVGFPSEITTLTTLKNDMNDADSIMFYYKEEIYILDGINYLKYDGTNLSDVSTNAYIPTTTISRSPSGGGEMYEDINLIQPKRKNSFLSNGTSTEYVLDATNIDSVDKVYVNGSLVSNASYTVNTNLGKVTFNNNSIPPSPTIPGQDNVIIEFTKTISGYANRIKKCTIAKVFDSRVFFSGNPDYPNVLFHSSLNNAAYISDLDYYECGDEGNPVKDIVIGNNLLWVFKRDEQTKDTIFYLQPSTAVDYGRIYPTKQGNISIGCLSRAVNYKDNILFFSRNGLEGIRGDIEKEQSVSHKSSLVDPKLINMSNYQFLQVAEYNGYLVVAIDNILFLADYRQTFAGVTGTEYEWYVWKLPITVKHMKEYKDNLYLMDNSGNIYNFSGTNDLNQAIEAYWTTPRDAFGYMQHLKKINKRGAILKIKNIQNSRVKIAEKTNKSDKWKLVKEVSGNGFSYDNMDYANFNYITSDNTYIVFRIKEKKILDLSLKIYSDIKNKPFGLIEISLEAFISGYAKR